MTQPAYRPMRSIVFCGRRRQGAVMVAALLCLLIVVAMIGTMLEGALRARRQLHIERDLRQTELLLQAGADRAMFRLLNEADYQGETWTPAEEALSGRGEVTIEITRDANAPERRVNVTAEYPVGSERSIRRSQTFLLGSAEQ